MVVLRFGSLLNVGYAPGDINVKRISLSFRLWSLPPCAVNVRLWIVRAGEYARGLVWFGAICLLILAGVVQPNKVQFFTMELFWDNGGCSLY